MGHANKQRFNKLILNEKDLIEMDFLGDSFINTSHFEKEHIPPADRKVFDENVEPKLLSIERTSNADRFANNEKNRIPHIDDDIQRCFPSMPLPNMKVLPFE